MNRPSQHAIIKLAKDAFEIAVADVPEQLAEKERQALAAASRTGNIAAYPDALVRLAGERVPEMFLAGVDAYLDVFTTLELPADAQTEKFFETVAKQIAAAATPWVQGQLDLYRMRTKKPVTDPGGHLNRTVQRGMSSAQKKAKFRIEQQRIKAKMTKDQPASVSPPESEDSGKPGFWRRMEARFRVLQRDDGPFAQWTATPYNEAGDQWYIGGADHKTREKFRWAAERAAVELGQALGNLAVFFWLDLLKRDSPDYRSYAGSDGADRGKIKCVCEASADYCLKLETNEVASERMSSLPEREEGTSLEEPGYAAISHADWREDAARARKPRPILRPVKVPRLQAIAALHKAAAAAVQSALPPSKQQLELCLWPALSKYAQKVFDKMAEAKLNARRPGGRPGTYARWLRSKCLPAVVDDVCGPVFGQFSITVRYVIEIIGELQSPEIDLTQRKLWGMLTEVFGDQPFTENLRKRLSTHLEGRSTRWEGKAAQPQSATKSDGERDRRATADKGNVGLLRGTDDKLKNTVTVDVACRFGGVSRRAIEKAIKGEKLKAEGERQNRRIIVQSLLKYFPPENNAN